MIDLVELAKLSQTARELLVAARKNHNSLFVKRYDQPGSDYVDAGSTSFGDPRDVAAVEDLCEAGYFRTENRQYYELTGRGMEAADALEDPATVGCLETIRIRKLVLDDLYRAGLTRGFNRAGEELGTQADRLSLEPDRVRAAWHYWQTVGAVELVPSPQGFHPRARLLASRYQICEAADRALAHAAQIMSQP